MTSFRPSAPDEARAFSEKSKAGFRAGMRPAEGKESGPSSPHTGDPTMNDLKTQRDQARDTDNRGKVDAGMRCPHCVRSARQRRDHLHGCSEAIA